MAKSNRCAPVGERKRGVVRVAQGNPVPAVKPDGTLTRHPRVYLRRDDPEYRMTFIVANRRYFGHTGHIDKMKAQASAEQAFNEALADWRERKLVARAYVFAAQGDRTTLLRQRLASDLNARCSPLTAQAYMHVTPEDMAKWLDGGDGPNGGDPVELR